jgi:hypothetical protein
VNDLYRLVPYLAALIAFLGSAYLFTRGPREGRFDCVAPLVQTSVTVATLGLYVGLLGVNISPALWLPVALAGIALGTYGSWSTTLELQPDGSIRTVRTMWYLAVLAATIGVSQLMIRNTAIHQSMFNGGLAAFYFGTGTAVASNVTLLVRAASLKKTTLSDILAPVRAFDWRKGTEGSPWAKLRERIAAEAGTSAAARPAHLRRASRPQADAPRPPARPATLREAPRCQSCGTVAKIGARFCRTCGKPLQE